MAGPLLLRVMSNGRDRSRVGVARQSRYCARARSATPHMAAAARRSLLRALSVCAVGGATPRPAYPGSRCPGRTRRARQRSATKSVAGSVARAISCGAHEAGLARRATAARRLRALQCHAVGCAQCVALARYSMSQLWSRRLSRCVESRTGAPTDGTIARVARILYVRRAVPEAARTRRNRNLCARCSCVAGGLEDPS